MRRITAAVAALCLFAPSTALARPLLGPSTGGLSGGQVTAHCEGFGVGGSQAAGSGKGKRFSEVVDGSVVLANLPGVISGNSERVGQF